MMPTYRLYCLRSGRMTKGEWVKADDASQAVAAASAEHPNSDCKVWLGKRLIATIPAGESPIFTDG